MYEESSAEAGIIERRCTVAQLIVHGRVALQTVTALANLLRPPLPQDFPQNPFPVDAQIAELSGQMGGIDQSWDGPIAQHPAVFTNPKCLFIWWL